MHHALRTSRLLRTPSSSGISGPGGSTFNSTAASAFPHSSSSQSTNSPSSPSTPSSFSDRPSPSSSSVFGRQPSHAPTSSTPLDPDAVARVIFDAARRSGVVGIPGAVFADVASGGIPNDHTAPLFGSDFPPASASSSSPHHDQGSASRFGDGAVPALVAPPPSYNQQHRHMGNGRAPAIGAAAEVARREAREFAKRVQAFRNAQRAVAAGRAAGGATAATTPAQALAGAVSGASSSAAAASASGSAGRFASLEDLPPALGGLPPSVAATATRPIQQVGPSPPPLFTEPIETAAAAAAAATTMAAESDAFGIADVVDTARGPRSKSPGRARRPPSPLPARPVAVAAPRVITTQRPRSPGRSRGVVLDLPPGTPLRPVAGIAAATAAAPHFVEEVASPIAPAAAAAAAPAHTDEQVVPAEFAAVEPSAVPAHRVSAVLTPPPPEQALPATPHVGPIHAAAPSEQKAPPIQEEPAMTFTATASVRLSGFGGAPGAAGTPTAAAHISTPSPSVAPAFQAPPLPPPPPTSAATTTTASALEGAAVFAATDAWGVADAAAAAGVAAPPAAPDVAAPEAAPTLAEWASLRDAEMREQREAEAAAVRAREAEQQRQMMQAASARWIASRAPEKPADTLAQYAQIFPAAHPMHELHSARTWEAALVAFNATIAKLPAPSAVSSLGANGALQAVGLALRHQCPHPQRVQLLKTVESLARTYRIPAEALAPARLELHDALAPAESAADRAARGGTQARIQYQAERGISGGLTSLPAADAALEASFSQNFMSLPPPVQALLRAPTLDRGLRETGRQLVSLQGRWQEALGVLDRLRPHKRDPFFKAHLSLLQGVTSPKPNEDKAAYVASVQGAIEVVRTIESRIRAGLKSIGRGPCVSLMRAYGRLRQFAEVRRLYTEFAEQNEIDETIAGALLRYSSTNMIQEMIPKLRDMGVSVLHPSCVLGAVHSLLGRGEIENAADILTTFFRRAPVPEHKDETSVISAAAVIISQQCEAPDSELTDVVVDHVLRFAPNRTIPVRFVSSALLALLARGELDRAQELVEVVCREGDFYVDSMADVAYEALNGVRASCRLPPLVPSKRRLAIVAERAAEAARAEAAQRRAEAGDDYDEAPPTTFSTEGGADAAAAAAGATRTTAAAGSGKVSSAEMDDRIREMAATRNWAGALEILNRSLRPDGAMAPGTSPERAQFLFTCALSAAVQQLPVVDTLRAAMDKARVAPNTTAFNTILTALSRAEEREQRWQEALGLFANPPAPRDVHTYSIALSILGRRSLWQDAVSVFNDMKKQPGMTKPTPLALSLLIQAAHKDSWTVTLRAFGDLVRLHGTESARDLVVNRVVRSLEAADRGVEVTRLLETLRQKRMQKGEAGGASGAGGAGAPSGDKSGPSSKSGAGAAAQGKGKLPKKQKQQQKS